MVRKPEDSFDKEQWDRFEKRIMNNKEMSIAALKSLSIAMRSGLKEAKRTCLTSQELYQKIVEMREAVKIAMDLETWRGDLPALNLCMAKQVEFKELFDELTQEARKVQKPLSSRNSKKKTVYSYEWLNDAEQDLPELYNLIVGKLITKDSKLEDFKKVFLNTPTSELNPIKWHEDNASELLFFITRLEETSNIEKTQYLRWERLISCFIKPDGGKFTANFKELNQKVSSTLSSSKQKFIDDIVKNFM